jgi:hypothetical protein
MVIPIPLWIVANLLHSHDVLVEQQLVSSGQFSSVSVVLILCILGGLSHALADPQGVQVGHGTQFKDNTRIGHVLGPAGNQGTNIGVREMSSLDVVVTRFVLHASMWIGCVSNEPTIRGCIVGSPEETQTQKFLMDHMRMNIQQLATILGKNEEYAQLLLHKVLYSMVTSDARHQGQDEWSSKAAVMEFETDFAKEIIRPLLNGLDGNMVNLRALFKADLDGAKSAILSVVEEEGDSEVADSPWQPQFWHPRSIINILSLEHKISSKKMKDRCPNLTRLLQDQHILTEVAALPEILKLQRKVKAIFDLRLDSNTVAKTTVDEFMTNHWPPEEATEWKPRIKSFLSLLKRTSSMIFDVGILGQMAKEALGEGGIDMNISCGILLPSPHGLGAFGLAITRVLVEAHNRVLGAFHVESGLDSSPISMDNIDHPDQLVTFDLDSLNMMLLANSRYELEVRGKGQPTKWSLNENDLETMIIEK